MLLIFASVIKDCLFSWKREFQDRKSRPFYFSFYFWSEPMHSTIHILSRRVKHCFWVFDSRLFLCCSNGRLFGVLAILPEKFISEFYVLGNKQKKAVFVGSISTTEPPETCRQSYVQPFQSILLLLNCCDLLRDVAVSNRHLSCVCAPCAREGKEVSTISFQNLHPGPQHRKDKMTCELLPFALPYGSRWLIHFHPQSLSFPTFWMGENDVECTSGTFQNTKFVFLIYLFNIHWYVRGPP